MVCVWKHINGLYLNQFVGLVEHSNVASLSCRVAADVHNALRVSVEYGVDYVGVHTGARRIGDDDIVKHVNLGQDVITNPGIEVQRKGEDHIGISVRSAVYGTSEVIRLSSVVNALTGSMTNSPSGRLTFRPPSLIAARCLPRAMNVTSCPARAM